MRKSLGGKRREIPVERAQDILSILAGFTDDEVRIIEREGKQESVVVSRVFPATHFGFRKITVERPLRLNFQASPERIALIEQERAFASQDTIRAILGSLGSALYKDRLEFERALDEAANAHGCTLTAAMGKAILSAFSERDETAAVCRDKDGDHEPDPELRDTESVPLSEAIGT